MALLQERYKKIAGYLDSAGLGSASCGLETPPLFSERFYVHNPPIAHTKEPDLVGSHLTRICEKHLTLRVVMHFDLYVPPHPLLSVICCSSSLKKRNEKKQWCTWVDSQCAIRPALCCSVLDPGRLELPQIPAFYMEDEGRWLNLV